MNQLKNNLKNLLINAHISENELARRTGVPQQAINRLLHGTNTNPKIATLIPLAKYFNITISQLLGESKLDWLAIPIIDRELLLKEPLDELLASTDEKILANIKNNEGIYALKLQDDSMEPKFSRGTILIVDSTKLPSNGDYVLLHTFEDIVLRQLLIKQNVLFKKCLNPNYNDFKPVILDNEIKIYGVLIQSRTNHLESD